MTDYSELCMQLSALIEGVPHTVANLANVSALLYDALEDVNWVGFYCVKAGRLVLGPFQGKPACIEIPLGKGVCGAAAEQDRTLVVPDVHLFEGHIACDCASNSEIVIPIHSGGRVVAVLDIDSPIKDRFTRDDADGLAACAAAVESEGLCYDLP